MIIYTRTNNVLCDFEYSGNTVKCNLIKHFHTDQVGKFKCPSNVNDVPIRYIHGIKAHPNEFDDVPGGLLHEYTPYDTIHLNYSAQTMESWSEFTITENDEFWVTDDKGIVIFNGTGKARLIILYEMIIEQVQ